MTSHEFAEKLKAQAEALLSKPVFEMQRWENGVLYISYYDDKTNFLAAAKSLGAGRKEWKEDELLFFPEIADIRLQVNRNAICRLVKPAEYDYEPLLSPDEEAQVGA